jgi:branched-chain amino acid transport system ATP-binding protein
VRRAGVGRTFQIAQTLRSFTVRENLQMAWIAHHGRMRALWPKARSLYAAEADAVLAAVGLIAFADTPCGTLAYGDLKRVELATALVGAPKLLLLDEPTAGMAPAERVEIMARVTALVRERGITLLFVEHDMDAVFGHAERVLVLDRGRLIADGTPDRVRQDARVQAVYLGPHYAGAVAP